MNDPGTGKERTNQNEGKSGGGHAKPLGGSRTTSGSGPTSGGGINRPLKKSSYQ